MLDRRLAEDGWKGGYHRRMSKIRASRKASSFTESVIREMKRLAVAHGAINL